MEGFLYLGLKKKKENKNLNFTMTNQPIGSLF
jgi:hypothetical protein